jgi:O-antigen/teichoic acid export membrane protein
LGIYIVIATVMALAAWPVQNYVDASLWQWRRSLKAHRLSVLREVTKAVIVTLVLCVALGIGSLVMTLSVLGPSYRSSVPLILPLGAAAIIYAVSRVLEGIFVAEGRGGAASTAETIGMGVSVTAYLMLIPLMGAMGAALGSLIGYAGCCVACVAIKLHIVGGRRPADSDAAREGMHDG